MVASFTLRNTWLMESVYCPLLLHVIQNIRFHLTQISNSFLVPEDRNRLSFRNNDFFLEQSPEKTINSNRVEHSKPLWRMNCVQFPLCSAVYRIIKRYNKCFKELGQRVGFLITKNRMKNRQNRFTVIKINYKFSTVQISELPQNYRCQKGDMKQVLY